MSLSEGLNKDTLGERLVFRGNYSDDQATCMIPRYVNFDDLEPDHIGKFRLFTKDLSSYDLLRGRSKQNIILEFQLGLLIILPRFKLHN